MRLPFGGRHREVAEARQSIAALHKEIAELEQAVDTSSSEAASTEGKAGYRAVRATMVREELAGKQAELEALMERLHELGESVGSPPIVSPVVSPTVVQPAGPTSTPIAADETPLAVVTRQPAARAPGEESPTEKILLERPPEVVMPGGEGSGLRPEPAESSEAPTVSDQPPAVPSRGLSSSVERAARASVQQREAPVHEPTNLLGRAVQTVAAARHRPRWATLLGDGLIVLGVLLAFAAGVLVGRGDREPSAAPASEPVAGPGASNAPTVQTTFAATPAPPPAPTSVPPSAVLTEAPAAHEPESPPGSQPSTETAREPDVPVVAEPALPTRTVSAPGFAGVNLRPTPSASGPVIELLPVGTRVALLDGRTTAGGSTWQEVRTAQGSVGWVLADTLEP